MNKLLKESKKGTSGITLIALVITIIVLLIILSVTVEVGIPNIKQSTDRKLISELGMLNHAILERYTKNSFTGQEYPGEKIETVGIDLDSFIEEINSEATTTITRKDDDDSNYYYITAENGGISSLGIKQAVDEYIVNYETGEVFNYTKKVTSDGEPLYTYSVDKTN